MTERKLLFCDACLEDIPDAKPGECFPPHISIYFVGDVGIFLSGSSKKDFHDMTCLNRFLAEAAEAAR